MKPSTTVMTREQLATYIGVSRKTLYNRLKVHNVNLPRGLLTSKEIVHICEIFNVEPPSQIKNGKIYSVVKMILMIILM